MAVTNNGAGRPAHNRSEIIEVLKRRYPNGSEFTSADDLFAANPDLLPKLKTLKNTAKESFGMPLGKYLLSIGLINSKTQPKEEDLFDYEAYLKNFVLEMKRRLEKMDFVPTCTSKLPSSFADMDFKLAKKCVKKIYGQDKALDQYLQESRVLNMPDNEDIEMLDYVKILKTRYQKAECLPTKLGDLIDENPDLPIRKLNKYIREVIGETKTEKYYIRNNILKGKETDLIEYDYCEIKLDYESHPYSYISDIEDLQVGEKVIVEFGWHGKVIGEVISITTCLGLDAPWPVSQTSTILRKASDDEIKNNTAHWTDEDKWLYEWSSDDSHEEYMVNNVFAHIPSSITYLEGKRELIKLIQNEQAANSMFVSPAYDKSMLPSFLFEEVGLKGGTYSENQRLYAIITRVHNTGRTESIEAIEQLNSGEILMCEYSNTIYIKNKAGIVLGHISNDISKTLIPMLNMQYAIIKNVKATYIRPLSKMNPEKKHPALYVMLLVELADMTEETKGGSSIVLYGNDWKVGATKATLIRTTVPLNIAYVIFNCPYNKTFEEYCKEMFGSDSPECKLITKYTQNTGDSGPTNSIYDLFWKYAVDETTRYWFGSNEVDYATWDANTAWGFNHWSEKIILVDDYDDPSDAFHGFGLSTIILSEG